MPLEDDSHNSRVHNPHDAFFKEVMGKKESACDFFRNYLPSEILKLADMNTLQIKKDSFIEKELRRFYSDILYQVSLKDSKAYFYLLFEHQSSPDRLIAFRLLRYIVKIWELELKQQQELKLSPPVIPLVLYHGEERWNTGDRLTDIIYWGDREELRLYLPDLTYSFYDFSPYSEAEIKGNILLRICLELFKHIFDKNLLKIEEIFSLLKFLSLKERTALEFIEAIFRYVMSVRNDATPQVLTKMVEKAISSKDVGGVIMTVAEQLREQGKKEGLEKGLEKGELIGDIRITQLSKGLHLSEKKELEKLSLEELEKMLKELMKI